MSKMTRFTPDMINSYISKGYWGTQRTSDVWDRNAVMYGDKEALVDSNKRLTWAQVKKYSDRLALWMLRSGFKKDEAVVMQLPNCVESFIVRLACEKAGVLCATAQMNFRHAEMEYVYQRLQAVGAIISLESRGFSYFNMVNEIQRTTPSLRQITLIGDSVPSGVHSVEEIMQQPLEKEYPEDYLEKTKFDATEIAVIALTSGTTGLPKIVEHPIVSRIALANLYARALKMNGDDVLSLIGNSILGGGAGMGYNGAAPLVGAKIVLLEAWDTEAALQLIEKERATVAYAVPAHLLMMLRHPNLSKYNLSSLRRVHHGTSPLSYEMAQEVEEKFGTCLVPSYGSFDGGICTMASVDDPAEVRWGTVGKPPFENEVKVVDDEGKEVQQGEVGEVMLRGAITLSGYYQDLDATISAWDCLGEDGWIKMGDLGRLDKSGNLTIVGRKKDVIIRGGQNIYPQEIEGMLLTHPKVAQAAVVGMPDPVYGERACAYIATKPGEQFDFDEMVSFLRKQNIASYKLPERLEIRDHLPTSELGKVTKRSLQEDVRRKLAAEAEA
ncbi:AMP-binding protein [Chloroflexota bacterium]